MSVTQGIQQLRLAVVDVAHDGDDRWTCDEILLIALVLAELKVEGLQQLAILVLRGHDLNVIVELAAQDLQGVVGHRLGGSHHLAKVEQHLHELRRLGIDLLGEIGQRGTTTQSDGLTIALADAHTADQRCLHLVELLPALLAGLATTTGTTTAKGTLGAATTTTTATTADRTARSSAEATAETAATESTTAPATAASTTTSTCLTNLRGLVLRHHGRVRTRHTGTATRSLAAARTRHTLTLTWTRSSTGAPSALRAMTGLAHSLAGGERVVPGTRGSGTTTSTRTRTGASTRRQPAGSPRARARTGTRLRGGRLGRPTRLGAGGRCMGLGGVLTRLGSRLGVALRCRGLLLLGATGRLHETRTRSRTGASCRAAPRLRASARTGTGTRRRLRRGARLGTGSRLGRRSLLGLPLGCCLRLASRRLRRLGIASRFSRTDLVTQSPHNWCLNG